MFYFQKIIFEFRALSILNLILKYFIYFHRFEEIGYIECQLRRIFKTPDHKSTRLWISEKSQVPRFRQLLLRFRMLNDCIHRDKVYILALEEHTGNDLWPTGEPGDAKGDMSKYNDITKGKENPFGLGGGGVKI